MSIPSATHARPSRLRAAFRSHRTILGTILGTAAVVGSTVAAPGAAGAATQPIIFGASGGASAIKSLSNHVGAPLATHVYGQLNGPIRKGDYINIQPNVSWRTLANSKAGSAPYNDLVRWAKGVKAQKGPILFSFSHEPEGKSSASHHLGTSADFVAAWRKLHDVFVSQGVRNVEYTWTMTSNAFRVKKTDARYASKWYPGDAYVDNVATAAYNWYKCGEGHGDWRSLSQQAAEPLAFAKAHHKKYVLAEWASDADSRRPQWLQDARQWMLANKANIRGAFYFQNKGVPGCQWILNTSGDYKAFGAMAKDRANFGG